MRFPVLVLPLLPLLLASGSAGAADVFVFKDVQGFERCLQADRVVVTRSKHARTEQLQFLEPYEIKQRCIAAAAKVLRPMKDKDADLAFIAAVRNERLEWEALDLVSVLVDHGLANCNELKAYEILTRISLSRTPEQLGPYYQKARAIVKRCLKDPQFKADFLEEKDRTNQLGANACEILLEEKLVKSCPQKKS
jgi:hypothetical protein